MYKPKWVLSTVAKVKKKRGQPPPVQPMRPRPKLLKLGWDDKTTWWWKDHLALAESLPFDGCVPKVLVDSSLNPWADPNFARTVLTPISYQVKHLQPMLTPLLETKFATLTERFFPIIMGNYLPPDWFEDWTTPLRNLTLYATAAQQAGIKGFYIDTELYGDAATEPLWDYTRSLHRETRSREAYQAQVQRRGLEVMTAIQSALPHPVLILTYGYYLSSGLYPYFAGSHPRYHLLPSFVDGLLQGASPNTLVIEGGEAAYTYTTERQFTTLKNRLKAKVKRLSKVPKQLAQYRMAFGLWLDKFPSMATWERALAFAMKHTEGYVWVYSEQIDAWEGKGVPQGFFEATKRGKL